MDTDPADPWRKYFAQYPPGNQAKGYIDYPFKTLEYKVPDELLATKL